MKKILLSIMVVAMVTGCSSTKKNETPTSNEATANGGTEKVESTAMNFSPQGSDSGSIEGLQTVHFEYDKSSLVGYEQKKLEADADWIKKNADVKILVEGHCDQRGSIEYNLSLGERRANAVKQMLIKLGVPADRISTTSFGKEKLIATGDSEEEMAQNRRANFVPSKK
jgi:peptidoglycan-associated lipoprotein